MGLKRPDPESFLADDVGERDEGHDKVKLRAVGFQELLHEGAALALGLVSALLDRGKHSQGLEPPRPDSLTNFPALLHARGGDFPDIVETTLRQGALCENPPALKPLLRVDANFDPVHVANVDEGGLLKAHSATAAPSHQRQTRPSVLSRLLEVPHAQGYLRLENNAVGGLLDARLRGEPGLGLVILGLILLLSLIIDDVSVFALLLLDLGLAFLFLLPHVHSAGRDPLHELRLQGVDDGPGTAAKRREHSNLLHGAVLHHGKLLVLNEGDHELHSHYLQEICHILAVQRRQLGGEVQGSNPLDGVGVLLVADGRLVEEGREPEEVEAGSRLALFGALLYCFCSLLLGRRIAARDSAVASGDLGQFLPLENASQDADTLGNESDPNASLDLL
mmetsp:Transcript_24919/g.46845  ORF Transcript_24919/g.46845 Transcript_24919/m.46845 type:complete len:392 (-) Transcript_24919:2855-4030(-)